jgi:hypothetical protein
MVGSVSRGKRRKWRRSIELQFSGCDLSWITPFCGSRSLSWGTSFWYKCEGWLTWHLVNHHLPSTTIRHRWIRDLLMLRSSCYCELIGHSRPMSAAITSFKAHLRQPQGIPTYHRPLQCTCHGICPGDGQGMNFHMSSALHVPPCYRCLPTLIPPLWPFARTSPELVS